MPVRVTHAGFVRVKPTRGATRVRITLTQSMSI